MGKIRKAHIIRKREQTKSSGKNRREGNILKINLKQMKLGGFNRIYVIRIMLWNVLICSQVEDP